LWRHSVYTRQGITTFQDVDLVGFYDVVPEAAKSLSQKYGGVTTYSDLETMFNEAKPDVVFYYLPPFAHGPEIESAKRRIPFFVEKPVVLDLDLGKKILDEVDKNRVLTGAGYMNRYRRSVNYAMQAFKADPPSLILGRKIGGTPTRDWWWIRREQSGTQMHEQVTHTVDQARYFAGEIESIQAFAARGFNKGVARSHNIDDAAVLNVKFKSGAVANIYLSCSSNSAGDVFMNVYAYDTAAVFEKWEQNLTLYKGRGAVKTTVNGEPDIFKVEDRAFIDAVKSSDSSLVKSDYRDALKTAAVTIAALNSLETGQPVNVQKLAGL